MALSPFEIMLASQQYGKRLERITNRAGVGIRNLSIAARNLPTDELFAVMKSGGSQIAMEMAPAVNELAITLAYDVRGDTSLAFRQLSRKVGSQNFISPAGVADDVGFNINAVFNNLKEGQRVSSADLTRATMEAVQSASAEESRAVHNEIAREDSAFEDTPQRVMMETDGGDVCDFCEMATANQNLMAEDESMHFHKNCNCVAVPVPVGSNRDDMLNSRSKEWQALYAEANKNTPSGLTVRAKNRAVMKEIRRIRNPRR